MVVTKAGLTVPASSQINTFQDGEIVDAARSNQNNSTLLGFLISLTNYCIDQTPQINAGVTSTYTDLQQFNGGIRVASIKDLLNSVGTPTNDDIVLSFDGTGKFKYGGTASTLEVATQLYVGQAIAAASVGPSVFMGATSGTAGTTGILPAPTAGQQYHLIAGGGSWVNTFGAATDSVAGNAGPVPTPAAGKARKPLRGDATFNNELPIFATAQNSNFTFLEDYIYLVDTSGGPVLGTLPAVPTDGARFGIKDYTWSCGTNNFTFGRNGKTMDSPTGQAADNVEVNVPGATAIFEYNAWLGGYILV